MINLLFSINFLSIYLFFINQYNLFLILIYSINLANPVELYFFQKKMDLFVLTDLYDD